MTTTTTHDTKEINVIAEMTTSAAEERRDALVDRVFAATIGTMDLATIYLGDRLGYYRTLHELRTATSSELSDRTGTYERYTREWLEQQAVTGILEVQDTGNPATRRYSLPAGHDEALLHEDSLAFIAPFGRQAAGAFAVLPALLDAYRTGGGVPYEDFGADIREGIAAGNRVQFINLLASEWIPAIPDIHERLLDTSNPARVADVGCGAGWSSIALAQGFPAIRVDGIDIDEASIKDARLNAANAGVNDRVRFHHGDAAHPELNGPYDLVCAFECIHDMANPVGALSAMRDLVGPGGTVLIVDERVADEFTAPGDITERFMYGYSVLHCLTVGMAEDGHSAETGTVMRSDTMRVYAAEAGFREVEILPIENDLWRFYRLTA